MNCRIILSSFREIRDKPKYLVFLIYHYVSNRSKHILKLLKSVDYIDWDIALTCVKEVFGSMDFFSKSDPLDWESIEIPLLILFLYQTLPQFKNQPQIEFKGSILEPLEKSLSLSNANHHAIQYNCSLEGSSDFFIKDTKFEIPQKSSEMLKIFFKGRFTKRSEAKLKLVSTKLGLNHSSIILFSLVSTINDLKPIKVFKLETEIYSNPAYSAQLNITNIFNQAGTFKISCRQNKVTSQ